MRYYFQNKFITTVCLKLYVLLLSLLIAASSSAIFLFYRRSLIQIYALFNEPITTIKKGENFYTIFVVIKSVKCWQLCLLNSKKGNV